jgi:superoxide dismutase, Cu-Zn family
MDQGRLGAVAIALALAIGTSVATVPAYAASVKINVNAVTAEGVGKPLGTVTATETAKGVEFAPTLSDLPPGDHGFHVHAKGSCDPAPDPDKGGTTAAAFGAGGHFDPDATGKHLGPDGMGHKGDLPALNADDNGKATRKVLAPHLKLADIAGHALMIHAGGDNYSDQPQKLGGGGARIACGVIQ